MKRTSIILLTLLLSFVVSGTVIADSIKYSEPPVELLEFYNFRKSRIVEPVINLMPHYPKKAFEERIEAVVWIRFNLDQENLPDSIEVLHCTVDSFGFEEAAIEWINSGSFLFNSNVRKDDSDWWYTKLEFTRAQWIWNLRINVGADVFGSLIPRKLDSQNVRPQDPEQKLPQIIHKPTVNYPNRALKTKLAGEVYVRVLVSEEGLPLDAVIDKSCDPEWKWGFNEAAMAGAMECRFSPAIQFGKPVKVWVSFPFEFTLAGLFIR